MQIAVDAIKQLRSEGQKMLKVADVLEKLNGVADGYRPKRKMSRAGRLKISAAQKKRWAKRRA